ncbi:MAG: sigma-70 family RNA polymerase sigma factor [Chloroflexi bacterium]|nr:sigma-70 family RNA polymerase sigma factor [Chloroflexota bacterium]
MTIPEIEWLSQARKGDNDAFTNLVEAYQTPVYNLCYRMLGEAGEAEDAAQESFWRAHQSLSKYDPQRPFVTWLLSIAAHYCIDQLRRRRLDTLSMDLLPEEAIPDSGTPTPEASFNQTEEQRHLRALLGTLGPQDRAAIIMRYWYDLSDEEIGQALSLSVSAVKSRLHRARRELARLWLAQQPQALTSERRQNEAPTL